MTTGRIAIFHQLSWLRAIAAAIVALYHIQETLLKPKYFGASAIPWASAGNAGVQLFFVLSGFVIYHAHHRDPARNTSAIARFSFKRFRRIYPTLWVVLTAMLALQYAGLPGFAPTPFDIVRAYAILPATREVILSVEWTLRHEILFYALFILFLWHRRVGAAVLIVWGLLSLPVALLTPDHRYAHFFFDQNHVLFLMGMAVAWLFERGTRAHGILALGGGVALFVAAYTVEIIGLAGHDALVQCYGLGTALTIYGFVVQPATNRRIAWLESMGGASYAMYLIHNPIVSVAAKAGVVLDRHAFMPLWIHALATFLACQVAALIFHVLLEKPILRLVDRRRASAGDRRMASPA